MKAGWYRTQFDSEFLVVSGRAQAFDRQLWWNGVRSVPVMTAPRPILGPLADRLAVGKRGEARKLEVEEC